MFLITFRKCKTRHIYSVLYSPEAGEVAEDDDDDAQDHSHFSLNAYCALQVLAPYFNLHFAKSKLLIYLTPKFLSSPLTQHTRYIKSYHILS